MEQEVTTLSLLYGCQKRRKGSILWPTMIYWHLTPPHVEQVLHSALQETTGLPQGLGHTHQCCPDFPDMLLCLMWEQTPAPVTDVNPASASFDITHTGNPWQAQELDQIYSSFSPELCDLWYCCNETCLRNFLMNAMKLCFTHALTPKTPHTLSSNHFNTTSQLFLYPTVDLFPSSPSRSVLSHVLFSLLYQ